MDVTLRSTLGLERPGARSCNTMRIEERKGLISAVSESLIRAAADQVIRHAWSKVREQLGEGT